MSVRYYKIIVEKELTFSMDRIIVFLFLFFLVFCRPVFAIPADADYFPAKHRFIWGTQFNHIFNRDFNKVESKAGTTQYFIKTSFGITERFFLDGKIGHGGVKFRPAGANDIDFTSGFAGGYGLRYVLYESPDGNIRSLFGFQHISCHPLSKEINGTKYQIIWDEWQFSWLLLRSWQKKSCFYFGPQYATTQLKYKVDTFRRRLKAEDWWGAVFGVNYDLNDKLKFNTEMRLFSEWAVNFGIGYKF
ncbi:MAG: hypothetical protein ABII75_03200 [Candidatus Omnitrophota bacterium]